MPIIFEPNTKTFYLHGKDITYAFFINNLGYAEHLYYGATIGCDDLDFSRIPGASSFAAKAPGHIERGSLSYNHFTTELSFFGTSDYREPCVAVSFSDGSRLTELLYDGHEILQTKPSIKGMPSLRGGETLILHLKDSITEFACDLYYTVYDDCSIVARRAVYKNGSGADVYLDRAYSFSLSLPRNDYEILSLYGSWAKERHIERSEMHHGVFSIDSKRCATSATLNPFMAIVDKNTDEERGNAYGINLIYSSSYALKAEGTNDGRTLVTGGINDFDFSWKLGAGESFETPEVVIAYSNEGLGGMSRAFHDAYRKYIINPRYVTASRPIVINNWEATYFKFDNDKLKAIAKAVEGTGIDTFVLDDGWFGKRDSDVSSLGDWVVNGQKLDGGLSTIINYVHSVGMKFGLWFEPEMISEDSDLFRAHPDYAIGVPNRSRCYSRQQYVLDLTRADVRDYIVSSVNKVLSENEIDYVKWDYNRNVTEFYSLGLAPERQKEFAHRYVLGVYDICERIVNANPDVFFEGCSGGGARYDAAMLHYFPQIWTSDDTDAEERTKIQYGTSLVYPLSAMSCHISVTPNHQTKRISPMHTRANIAHLGATGYELDTSEFTDEDRDVIRTQIESYKSMEKLVLTGDLYRTEDPFNSNFFGFMIAAKDKKTAVLTVYRRMGSVNNEVKYFRISGLDASTTYRIEDTGIVAKGSTLMNIGIPMKLNSGDFQSARYVFNAID